MADVDDDGKTPLERLKERRARAKEAMERARALRNRTDGSSSNLRDGSSSNLRSDSAYDLQVDKVAEERRRAAKKAQEAEHDAEMEKKRRERERMEEELRRDREKEHQQQQQAQDENKSEASAVVASDNLVVGAKSATYELLHQKPVAVVKKEKCPANVTVDESRYLDLRFSIAGGDKVKVEELLQTDPLSIVWGLGEDGATVTTEAAQLGFASILALLLKAGAPVNVPDDDGVTPLMYACGKGSKTCVKLLLACGADPEIRDEDGSSASDYASSGPVRALLKVTAGIKE